MNIISPERIQPAADIREVARETPLLPAEKKAISTALAKLQTIATIGSRYGGKTACERSGEISQLHKAVWQAGEAFAADPSEENAASVASASIAWACSDTVSDHLQHYSEQARAAISAGLQPIAAALLERAEQAMAERLKAAQAVLDGAPSLEREARAFAAKCEAAKQLVASQREMLASDPLRWLMNEIAIEI